MTLAELQAIGAPRPPEGMFWRIERSYDGIAAELRKPLRPIFGRERSQGIWWASAPVTGGVTVEAAIVTACIRVLIERNRYLAPVRWIGDHH